MDFVFILVGFTIGVGVGIFVLRFAEAFIPRGILYIDTDHEDQHVYRFEIDDLSNLENRKKMIMHIRHFDSRS